MVDLAARDDGDANTRPRAFDCLQPSGIKQCITTIREQDGKDKSKPKKTNKKTAYIHGTENGRRNYKDCARCFTMQRFVFPIESKIPLSLVRSFISRWVVWKRIPQRLFFHLCFCIGIMNDGTNSSGFFCIIMLRVVWLRLTGSNV